MSGLVKGIFNLFKQRYYLNVAYDFGDKDKIVVVLLHGIAATSNSWGSVIDKLDPKKCRVVAIDLLGFGKSPKPTSCNYDIKDHVKSLRLTINEYGITKPFILVGHSMGSIIATDYAKSYPADVRELFLLSLPIYQKTDKSYQSNMTQKRIDLFLKAYHYIAERKEVAIKYSKSVRKILKLPDGVDVNEDNWYSFQKSLINTVVKQTVIDNIKDIAIPINIIYGSLDGLLIKKNLKRLVDKSNVSITKIPGVHHLVNNKFATVLVKKINQLLV